MSEMYDKLSATFPNVHKKPGTGQEYITGEQVASRLNEVLGWDRWSFRIVEHGYNEAADELWALGELVVNADSGHVIRQQFGSQKPNRYTKNNAIIDFGFDLKGACTDALKKCATLIGVGLYLLEKDTPGERQQVGATSAAKERPANAPAAAPPKRKLSEITAQMGYALGLRARL